ncbi:MAG: alpha/beta hydrolase [Actinobacteria bacterium]|nr:alpha/beta hydrolase [Actinomycetota bacterium]
MQTLEVNGQKARVLDEGDGVPVVVLHGWGGKIESMMPVIRCLGPRHRVIAIDLPGFGDSPLPQGAWGTPDYATFARDLVSQLGVERAHFIGHSFGAKVSFYLASVYPKLVDKLVLVGSPGLRTPPSAAARVKRVASRAGRVAGKLGPPGAAFKRALYKRIASSDYQEAGELRPILVKVVNEDFRELLPRVKSPTLLVWGSEDDAAPLVHGKEMEKLIPDAGLVVFEGAGHFAYLDEGERFCRVVRHFFGGEGG